MTPNATIPTSVTVGDSTAVRLLPRRLNRTGFVIQNAHATNSLYLGFGASPTSSNGIRLLPGEAYTDSGQDVYTGRVYGIASGASTDVRVVEFYYGPSELVVESSSESSGETSETG